ncbi:PQQ-binding-like beta-propeller repeat protein [Jiangella muralis]|uniref:outer membrane protein assembly factor BamB family protein n=1 Tax=Jiangella muralis TaxID=702383 RepID=UPI00069F34DD|nr:PQQ-binding-like beta-propeller repeat protein [Jiangella muralis]
MTTAAARGARVVRHWATGADVRQVAEFAGPGGAPCVLVLAGATLQAWRWDGTLLWSDGTSAVTRVLHVRDDSALVLSGERLVRRLSLCTGASSWAGTVPDGTNLSGPGSSKLALVGGRLLWFTAPAYATAVTCRELLPGGDVSTVWVREFGGHYDAGFGPVLVVADVLGSGEPQLLLSTRTGSGYGTGDADVSSERLVLGREDGRLLQLVLSVSDGSTLTEVAFRPDPGDYPCARPYGLLTTAAAPAGRIVVLVSCQVEEYYSVTRVRDGELARAWGRFVEKDWPHDAQELRPQVSSVVERPDGNPWLVTGHHDGATWTTVVDDAVTGERVAALPGHYLWGVTGSVAVVSPAVPRTLTGAEPTLAVRLPDLTVAASFTGHPVVCGDDELPAELSFHAERRSLVALGDGVVMRLPSGAAAWWSPVSGASAPLGVADVAGAFPGGSGAAVLVSSDGALHRVGADLAAAGSVRPAGRRASALPVTSAAGPVVLLDGPRDSRAVLPDGVELPLPGRVAAAGRTPSGAVVVACLEDTAVRCWKLGSSGWEPAGAVTTRGRPSHALLFDDASLLLAASRTGVHTADLGVYRLDGTALWQDPAQGPHPNLPAVARTPSGRWLAAYDDHGQFTARDAHTGEVLTKDDWTAAYTTPLRLDTPPGWLRVGGIHGIDLLDDSGGVRWRHGAPLWTYFPGEAAVAGSVLGCMTRSGRLDAFDVASGRVLWNVDLGPVAARPPLVALDDGFVAGTAAGALVAVDASSGDRRELLSLGAAVETLAVGGAGLLAGTADGVVHEVAV